MADSVYHKRGQTGICRFCDLPVSRFARPHHARRCDRHLRINRMWEDSRLRGKVAPKRRVIDAMMDAIVPDMTCPKCNRKMEYHAKINGMASVVSIQHWPDGSISFLCVSCNSRHGNMSGGEDRFKEITAHTKSCSACKVILPLSDFTKGNTYGGKAAQCRNCSNEASRKYHEENRLKILARKRRIRLASKA